MYTTQAGLLTTRHFIEHLSASEHSEYKTKVKGAWALESGVLELSLTSSSFKKLGNL